MKRSILSVGFAALALAATSAAYATARDLEGHWRTARDDSGVTDLDIRFDGRSFDVRADGQCGRDPCSWGEATGTPVVAPGGRDATDAIGFGAAFRGGEADRQLYVIFTGGDRVQVITIRQPREAERPAVWTTDTLRRDERSGLPLPPPPPPPN